jgi:acid phosphatase (class A)
MKKILIVLSFVTSVFVAFAQTSANSKRADVTRGNFLSIQAFDISHAIPEPPKEGSLAASADLETVLRVQSMRTEEQIAWAKTVDKNSLYMYQSVLGDWFTKEKTPITVALIRLVEQDSNGLSLRMKALYKRPRPSTVSSQVEPCVTVPFSGSYPSGHSFQAYARAAVLAEIFPDKRDALFLRAHEIAWGRIIAGVHFPTDIEGGRLFAEALVKEILKNPKFVEEINKARLEVAPFLVKKAA